MGQYAKSDAVKYWMDKERACIEAAKREYDAEEYEFAINRLYYSLFYGASALLLARDLTFKKHSGLRAAFHKEIVKPGIVDEWMGKLYDQLFADHQEGDYYPLASFEKEYVSAKLRECEELVIKLSTLL